MLNYECECAYPKLGRFFLWRPNKYTGEKRDCGRKALYSYCKFIIRAYGPEYLGSWGEEELKTEMEANAKRGFRGMVGSIDCTHWLWKNCPIAWQGMYQDRNHNRSIVC